MTDYASEYPTRLDPEPPTLEDEFDTVGVAGLRWAVHMIQAIQGEIGAEPANFNGVGGFDFKTVGDFIRVRFRMEYGKETMPTPYTAGSSRVQFTANRFASPPVVLPQAINAAGTGQLSKSLQVQPKRITKKGFTLGWMNHTLNGNKSNNDNIEGKSVYWLAFAPPFGVEATPDDDED